MKLKKEVFTHFSFMISFFILISLYRKWFDVYYIPFWFGGILGTLLPYADQLIYVYLIKPADTSSQRITAMLGRQDLLGAAKSLVEIRYHRDELIFHNAQFQLLFLILTFFVVSSSGSVFGWGIVLAFSLHLFIDQIIDLVETDSLKNWFSKLPINLDKQQKRWYLVFNFLILLVLGLFM
ncbi:hypothetical protein JXA63_01620 [Candidatus Woesebacteria bacterium]|nr:hypothetical protein [Candidatus Woesebacteria bacterium]